MTIWIRKNTPGKLIRQAATPFSFPGGEMHLKFRDEALAEDGTWVADVRGGGSDDLMALGLLADTAHERFEPITLMLPYLPAARADRGVPFGGRFYAKMINSFDVNQVLILDPHSETVPKLIDRRTIVDHIPLIQRWIQEDDLKFEAVIAPDRGATERTRATADALGLPMYQAHKHRDFDTGVITDITVDPLPGIEGKFLVVDDICDGGGTFNGLAAATGLPSNKLGLWVTHGIFSGNAPYIRDHYDHIGTTDSHPGAHRPSVGATIIPCVTYMEARMYIGGPK